MFCVGAPPPVRTGLSATPPPQATIRTRGGCSYSGFGVLRYVLCRSTALGAKGPKRRHTQIPDTKKPADSRFFCICRTQSGGGSQGLDVCVQAALVTSGLVLGDDALVGHAVDDRNGSSVGGLGFFQILGVDRFYNVLDVGTNHGAQACIVIAALLGLLGAFLGLR